MRRWRTVLLLASVVAAGCSNGSGTDQASEPSVRTSTTVARAFVGRIDVDYTGSGPKVAILGDSIMAMSRGPVTDELHGYAVRMGAIVGEGLGGGKISRGLGGGSMVEVAGDYLATDPDILVVALGTNDAWDPRLDANAAVAALAKITAGFHGRCLVTVAVTESANAKGYRGSEAHRINAALEAAADEVVDWPALARAHPDRYLKPDGIHPTPAGSAVLASELARAVRSCPDQSS